MREAVFAVLSGRIDTALVIGVEKLSVFGRGPLPLEASDAEVYDGMIMPAAYAMRAQRYLLDYGCSEDTLAQVVVKARACGAENPNAYFRQSVSAEKVLASRTIAVPLTLMMCCAMCDGAAAVVLTARNKRRPRDVVVEASVLRSSEYDPTPHPISFSTLTRTTAAEAYADAGIEPADVDVAEIHDAFAIAELMYYEALGFCEVGAGASYLADGSSCAGGAVAVNPSGGLLARGHPVGATGAAQICELYWQLRGDSPGPSVENAKVAVAHCTGGGIAGLAHGACTMHVLTT